MYGGEPAAIGFPGSPSDECSRARRAGFAPPDPRMAPRCPAVPSNSCLVPEQFPSAFAAGPWRLDANRSMMVANMLARGLYAIVDVDLTKRAGFEVLDFSAAVIDARPALVQLRAKNLGGREHLRLLERIVRRAESSSVPIYANDRPDLAILAGCAGVHVGQSDVSVSDIRRLGPELKVGLSTATEEQLREALSLAPDYVAVGPVYPTNSKSDADPAVGIRFLANASAAAKAADIPLVAIGGIDHGRASSIVGLAPLAAAISALIPPAPHLGTVSMLTRALHLALGGE